MRHIIRSGGAALALIAVAAATRLEAQAQPAAQADPTVNMTVPASIHQLNAWQVVEQVIAQRHGLLLSDPQFAALTSLNKAVRDGRPIYEPTGRTKPPYEQLVRVTTPEQALAKAFAVLTPPPQHQSLMLFARLDPQSGR